jgi:pimeloyl-ACP methyl ester carboxylesterase
VSGGAPDPLAALDAAAVRRWTPLPGGGRLAWRQWGAGRPLLLLHGASGSWAHWVRNVPALAARRRVLAPDLPGFGDSDLPPGPPSAEALAAPVAEGLDALEIGALDVAGFSMGGIVAGLLAARLGGRVGTLVLAGPNGMALPHDPLPPLERVPPGADAAAAAEVHRTNLRRLMLADPAAADDLAVRVHAHNLARARFRSAGIPEGDALLRALAAVRAARLVGIWGARDAFAAGHLEARRLTLARIRPDVAFHVVPGAGHWVIYEAAAAVDAILAEAL